MYEALIRNYDVQTVELPSVAEHQRKLKDVETKKAERRKFQINESKERKAQLEAKKAVEGAASTEDSTKRERDEEEPEESAKRQKLDEDEAPNEAAPQTVASGTTNGAQPAARSQPIEPTKVLTSRQLTQIRGHTSFLTFATLVPSDVPQANGQEQPQINGRTLERTESAITQAEMDDLCNGAMDITQSTV